MKPRLYTLEMIIWIKIAEGDQISWMARVISCVHLNFLSDQVSWLLPGAKWAPGSDLNPPWKGKYTGNQRKKIRAKITSWLQTWDISSITGFNTWYHIFCQYLPVGIICCFFFLRRYSPKGLFVNQFSCSVMSDSLQPHGLQHTRLPCPSPTPGAYSNSCPLSWWCHTTISFSVISFSSCLQSFPASGSFPVSHFFTSGGQSIGASASVLPMNIQDWFPLGWIWLDLPASPGDSQESSLTSQFKSINSSALSFLSFPALTSILLEKPKLFLDGPLSAK